MNLLRELQSFTENQDTYRTWMSLISVFLSLNVNFTLISNKIFRDCLP